MLHLIFSISTNGVFCHRFAAGDDLIFLQSASYAVLQNGELVKQINQLKASNINLYVLYADLETRGIDKDIICSDVEMIDMNGLVTLTEKNKVIKSWR